MTAANRQATLGSVSSIPTAHTPRGRGGEPDPYLAIRDPDLRLAVMRAHHAWAERYAPWLLERWLDE